ncbi:DUF1643 domain-containing protein [Jeotgalibaca sp. MA1X17-3]|uniref:DUF1643 domain-containing protein n=1 Tax=Jeotgalibaca sp. MA1X17-3 TaxID=2908211 RepID=UPI001F1B73F7|nr:DUF1643 domain-containing protein [Jeotgalibaca sp. MA1X17-3]UJF15959.1 DUF1643 domain-containing protein [Jeotgalibaca sp. MA1X17-3]
MVKELTMNITSKVIEEDSGEHRYVLEKVWDTKRPMATVITLYPSTSELVIADTTTMLITNNVYKLGYGGYFSVNLFSKVNLPDSPMKKRSRRNYKTATNKTNDEYILECCKKSDVVILAHGSLPSKNKQVKQRLEKILNSLKKDGLMKKTKTLIHPTKKIGCHPLAPNVRNNWLLEDSSVT